MKKQRENFDAQQQNLSPHRTPVNHDWFSEWLMMQLGEHPEMPPVTDVWNRLAHGAMSKIEINTITLDIDETKIFEIRAPHHGGKIFTRTRRKGVAQNAPCTVPRWGEIALLFALPKKARETLPGDLAEEFSEIIVPKMGLRLARFWYWSQVLRAMPWTWLVALYEVLKRKIGL